MVTEKVGMQYLIEERFKEFEEILKTAFHQAVICGEVTIRFTEDHKLEIVNPFQRLQL